MCLPCRIYRIYNECYPAEACQLLACQELVDLDPYPVVEFAKRIGLEDFALEYDIVNDIGRREIREERREPEERGARFDVIEVRYFNTEFELVKVRDDAKVERVIGDISNISTWKSSQ